MPPDLNPQIPFAPAGGLTTPWAVMRLLGFLFFLALTLIAPVQAETAPIATGWDRITVPPMKTSIYIGSVTLALGVLERHGSTLDATYTAKVFPWFFWGETGRITITLSDENLASLSKGEVAEFTGEGFNQKNRPRKVTGRAQPVDATSGKFKVRISADGYELIFNSTYRFGSKGK